MTQNNVQKLPEHSVVHSELGAKVLIKTPFVETTRDGKHLYSVLIALTPRSLIIKSNEDCTYDLVPRDQSENKVKYEFYHPLETTKVAVFKNSRRQSIKVCFSTNTTKYFELGQLKKRKIFWKLWCIHVAELNTYEKIWPFVHFRNDFQQTDEYLLKNKKLPWTEKHLYLGSKRAAEDNDRPKPVPGLGPAEDIKLLYLKPKYFGCWDQSEHWVQCGNSSNSFQYLN